MCFLFCLRHSFDSFAAAETFPWKTLLSLPQTPFSLKLLKLQRDCHRLPQPCGLYFFLYSSRFKGGFELGPRFRPRFLLSAISFWSSTVPAAAIACD